MKHNKSVFVLLSLLSFSLLGCQKKDSTSLFKFPDLPSEKAYLKKVLGATLPFELKSEKEINDIARYEDAAIIISRESCRHCIEQRKLVNQYIAKTNALIYEINLVADPSDSLNFQYPYKNLVESQENKTGSYSDLYPKITGTPTWLFYHEGKLIATYQGTFGKVDDTKPLSYEVFKSQLEEYVTPINLYVTNDYETFSDNVWDYHHFKMDESGLYQSLTYAGLENLLLSSDKKETTVYYNWRRCGDCKNYKKILYPYLTSHPEASLFEFEVDGYYQKKRRDDDENIKNEGLKEFADFSKKFSLYTESYYNTDVLGNKAGVVPTLVTYGATKDINVFANDMKVIRNEDGTLSYQMAFLESVKALRSTTKVEEGDNVSSTYQKARKELASMALPLEAEASLEFLKEHVK